MMSKPHWKRVYPLSSVKKGCNKPFFKQSYAIPEILR